MSRRIQPSYIPTPEEIRERTKAIRAKWPGGLQRRKEATVGYDGVQIRYKIGIDRSGALVVEEV